ncbi:MAG: transketolase [Deltaproteobacteria bacterium]|nr:transketolase [Deltaproteobacteria bacterium]
MPLSSEEKESLVAVAAKIRSNIVEMTCIAGSGHPGGSLSAVEILTVLFNKVMKIDPKNPDWPDRDRFVLSKGHAASALYGTLIERGFFPREEMNLFRNIGGILQGHPNMTKVPGLDISSGSLGQGLSVATGMALGAKLQKKDFRVYAIIGCGESQEGQIWEAGMAAAQFQLDNLTAFLDNNGVQLDGNTSDIIDIEPVVDKWRAFRWEVFTCDGHNMEDLLACVEKARQVKGKPSIIIAKTTKGKGVSFMEDTCTWHGVGDESQLDAALEEVK